MPGHGDDSATARSKLLSYVLRHAPGSVGLTLDAGGWVSVEQLLSALEQHGKPLARAELEQLVKSSDKQRFLLSADGTRIRASQGHSTSVDLGYSAVAPPAMLFHGTVARVLASILAQGLLKGERHHVHLSAKRATAVEVAKRRGAPVVLEIAAGEMAAAGHEFFCSDNGVWLTDHVPAQFLRAESPPEG